VLLRIRFTMITILHIIIHLIKSNPTRSSSLSSDDYKQLKEFLVPFAQQMLKQRDEFYPFGAAVEQNGQLVAVGVYEGTEHPNYTDVANMLLSAWASQAAPEQRSFGICVDVRFPISPNEKSDALKVMLRSRTDQPRDVIVPYHKELGGSYVFLNPMFYQPENPNSLQSAATRVDGY
jgi:hypothetical protein